MFSLADIERRSPNLESSSLGSVLENWVVCLRSDVGPSSALASSAGLEAGRMRRSVNPTEATSTRHTLSVSRCRSLAGRHHRI
jgi:hypothetical protein